MRRTGWALGGCVCLWSGLTAAQSQGFAVDRFDTADRGSDWLAADSLDLRGTLRWAAGATLDYAYDPLVAYTPDGDVAAKLVEHQLYTHLGGALTLGDRFRVGLTIPVLVTSSGQVVDDGVTVYEPPDGAALGDVRLAVTGRIIGEYQSAFSLAGGLWMFIPSGSASEYASDGKVRLTPHLAVAGLIGPLEYAARTGVQVRTLSEGLGDEPFGTELQLVAAGGTRLLDRKLLLGLEALTSTVLSGDGFLDREATPFELLASGHYRHQDFVFGLGVGPGLTRGFGSPALRAVLSVDWSPSFDAKGGAQ